MLLICQIMTAIGRFVILREEKTAGAINDNQPRFNSRLLSIVRALSLFVPPFVLLFAEVAVAGEDRLSLPSSRSDLAGRSLLLDITSEAGRIYAVGERGHILFSEDQGQAWYQAEVPVSVTLTAVHFTDETNGWVVGHDGAILRSRDGGRSWQKQLDGFQVNQRVVDHYRQLLDKAKAQGEEELELIEMALEEAEFAQQEGPSRPFLDVLFIDQRHGWAIGSYGLIFETVDGGEHWIPRMDRLENPDGFHLNAMMRTSRGELMIAGEAGILFRSPDNGETWQLLKSPYDGSFYALTELLPSQALLVMGLRGRGFRSDDYGKSWIELDMGTRTTLTSALQLDSGELIAAGNSGNLSVSLDGGEQFSSKIQQGRRSYSGLVMSGTRGLILVGQGGISTLGGRQLQGVLR